MGTLGLQAAWAGAVSDDCFGHEITEKSRSARLDMRFIQRVSLPPLIAMVYQSDPPRYLFLGSGTADLAFEEAGLPDGWKAACELAHFGSISLVRDPLAARLEAIAADLKRRGVRISYDPNYRDVMGDEFPLQFRRMAELADIIKISDEDLACVYPDCSVDSALLEIRRLAPEALILFTRGTKGVALHTPDGSFQQPAYQLDAVADTVGAGDACIGAFISSLLLEPESSHEHHLRFAAATAAAACTQTGPYAPQRREVDRILRRHG
jgi:fructokinase